MKTPRIGHILAIVIFGVVIWRCHRSILLELMGERANATIEEYEQSVSQKPGHELPDEYQLRYISKNGHEYEARLMVGPLWLQPNYGDPLAILYDPDNPSVVAHDSRIYNWSLPLIASCVVIWLMLDPQLRLLARKIRSRRRRSDSPAPDG